MPFRCENPSADDGRARTSGFAKVCDIDVSPTVRKTPLGDQITKKVSQRDLQSFQRLVRLATLSKKATRSHVGLRADSKQNTTW